MKTLNRTLSLALVFALVFSLMSFAFAADTTTTTTTTTTPTTTTTTTPAATTTNTAAAFTDASSISHNNAVSTMTSLAVIKGYPDGSYKPATNVTRAEMAKMICLILNGGKEPVLSTSNTPKYTDIKGHWAQAYIEYCASANIVAGMGDGSFHPDDTVTASQAAKMLLVAMNYKADVFGFTGADWEVNVNVAANKANIYKDITDINASANLNRDNAAQMIYNAIFANTMSISYTQDQATGKITQGYKDDGATLAVTKFSLNVSTATLGAVTYNSAKKEYSYTVGADEVVISGPYAGKTGIINNMKSTTDYSAYVNMKVRILWNIVNGTYTVYGVYPYDSSVVLSGIAGQLVDGMTYEASGDITTTGYITSFTYGGKTYKFEGSKQTALTGANNKAVPTAVTTLEKYLYTTKAAATYAAQAKTAAATAAATATAGGKTTAEIAAASQAAANAVHTAFIAATSLSSTITFADCIHQASYILQMLDTDGNGLIDKVVAYPFTVEPVTFVSSTNATIGGTSYTLADVKAYDGMKANEYVKHTAAKYTATGVDTFEKITTLAGTITEVAAMKATLGTTTLGDFVGMTAGATYENIYQVNGFIYEATMKVDAASASKFVVATTAVGADDYTKPVQKFLFSDGTIKQVEVSAGVPQHGLYTYTVSSGVYTMTAVSDANKDKFYDYMDSSAPESLTAASYLYTKGTINGYSIDDGAVVFARTDSGYKVITGKELKTAHALNAAPKILLKQNSTTGFETVLCASVDLRSVVVGSTKYGYVTKDLSTTKDKDGNDVSKITFWNGTEEVSKTADNDYTSSTTVTTALTKGQFFTYTEDKDGIITVLDANLGGKVDFFAPTVGKVSAYDSASPKSVALDGTNCTINDDTVIFNLDTANYKGVAGNAIVKNSGNNNAAYLTTTENGTTYVLFVAIDIPHNTISNYTAPTAASFGSTATTADVQAALNAGKAVTINGDWEATVALDVPAAATLNVTGKLTTDADFTNESTTGVTVGTFAPQANVTKLGTLSAGTYAPNAPAIKLDAGTLTLTKAIAADANFAVAGTDATQAAAVVTTADVALTGTHTFAVAGNYTAQGKFACAAAATIGGNFVADDTVNIASAATLTVTGTTKFATPGKAITLAGTFTNTGAVTNVADITISKASTTIADLTNSGTVAVKAATAITTLTANTGKITVADAVTLTITGNADATKSTSTAALKRIYGGTAHTAQLTLTNASKADYTVGNSTNTVCIFKANGSGSEYSANASVPATTFTYGADYTWAANS